MNSLKEDENHALCLDCGSTVARSCVYCNSTVSPSKFNRVHARSALNNLKDPPFPGSTLITDKISTAEAAGSEMVCSREDLLPMVIMSTGRILMVIQQQICIMGC